MDYRRAQWDMLPLASKNMYIKDTHEYFHEYVTDEPDKMLVPFFKTWPIALCLEIRLYQFKSVTLCKSKILFDINDKDTMFMQSQFNSQKVIWHARLHLM